MTEPVRALPEEGFPPSADAVHAWFVARHGREPGAEELTAILNAMALRDATPPIEGAGVGETG
jgi:hypothetical protein